MKTSTRMRRSVIAIAGGALVVALPGCAARENPALERARASYDAERRSPVVTTYARPELDEAENTLLEAEAAFEREEETTEVSHLSAMVEKQVDIARARAKERAADAQNQALNQERDQILAELQARETERGLFVTLGDVLFETDKAELRPSAAGKLLQLVQLLQESPDRLVLIEGHADARGPATYNLDLSERRALSVGTFLVASGIDSGRIVAAGYGEDYPVASNATAEGQTMNRRVEVVLLNPGVIPDVTHLMVR
jgi:outer membrane protein OmpA-like peptidoglycan-associated protein